MSGTNPAGWYRSSQAPELLRYWDGEIWTENTRRVGYVARPTAKVAAAKIVTAQLSDNEMIEAGFSTRMVRATFYVATTKRVIVIEPRGLREHDVHSIDYNRIESIEGRSGSLTLKVQDQSFSDLSVYEAPVEDFVQYVSGRMSQAGDVDLSDLARPSSLNRQLADEPPIFAPPLAEPTASSTAEADSLADDDSLADELIKLAGLHRDGMLTDDEFATAKAKLLE